MKIISKFHDYYDSARAYGEDPDLVYVRHEDDSFPIPDDVRDTLKSLCLRIPSHLAVGNSLQTALIGFCGNLYPVWYAAYDQWVATEDTYQRVLDDMKPYPASRFFARELERAREAFWPDDRTKQAELVKKATRETTDWMGRPMVGCITKPSIEACRNNPKFKGHTDMFVDLGLPVFVYSYFGDRHYFTANPQLSRFGFVSVFDPWTAYQELAMFVGGVLPRNNGGTVEITDDKVIRDAKGHDNTSFKMPSPGKKIRRRTKSKA